MRLAFAGLALLLSGCALTPDQVRETGHRFTYSSQQEPRLAALCVTRYIENVAAKTHLVVSNMRELTGGQWEVVEHIGTYTAYGVYRFTPSGPGTTVDVWIKRDALGTPREWADARLKGC